MAKRGGLPGGMMPGNMHNIMKPAQKMQRTMEENTEALEAKVCSAVAEACDGAGIISGKKA